MLVEEKATSLFSISRDLIISAAVWLLSFALSFSHLIGRETINIPEIFSGVHGFTGNTVIHISVMSSDH